VDREGYAVEKIVGYMHGKWEGCVTKQSWAILRGRRKNLKSHRVFNNFHSVLENKVCYSDFTCVMQNQKHTVTNFICLKCIQCSYSLLHLLWKNGYPPKGHPAGFSIYQDVSVAVCKPLSVLSPTKLITAATCSFQVLLTFRIIHDWFPL
jgi:hypothetical protein